MAKIFTITEGLENLGALKSGGQGSVYKARRVGEIITAIKILPTPIASESEDDKHFRSFQNEVQKLRKVNEVLNPNVVHIIASGITSSGNLPYIEMEYIEGPDLAELLTVPHDPVFTIKEVIKVADHLSNALAHCHSADVKHGDIKSNNIKFNQRTGNYMLLDFGLSIMSDEQRRTSIRHAGAIEFMAPEQSSGETLFETDIYSFGVILFELLSGNVPFPLFSKGEIARNAVMVAHMETPVPDLLSLRRLTLPGTWSQSKKDKEMMVPGWVVEMIYKCLEKSPANRFKNGRELQDFIHSKIIAEENNKIQVPAVPAFTDEQELRRQAGRFEIVVAEKDNIINDLRNQVENIDKELYQYRYTEQYNTSKKKGVSKSAFLLVLSLAMGLAGYNLYKSYFLPVTLNTQDSTIHSGGRAISVDSSLLTKPKTARKAKTRSKKVNSSIPHVKPVSLDISGKEGDAISKVGGQQGNKYKVIHTAYFYDSPDVNAWRDEYLSKSQDIYKALREENEFIFVRFVNSDKETSQGWLLKKSLRRVYE